MGMNNTNTIDAATERHPALNKLEREIFQHRLNVPDAIADGLEDSGHHPDDVAAVMEKVEQWDWVGAREISEGLAHAIIEDIVDGSTYAGCADHETSPQKFAAILKAGDSLAFKVSEFIGRPVRFPHH